MALYNLMLAIVLCLLTQVWQSEAGDVKEFQDWDSFQTDLKSRDLTLVDFFASWCPHCVTLAPKYEQAASIISHKRSLKDKVQLVKIQCDSEKGKAICSANKIEGFPTINVYQKGKQFDQYQGGRTSEAFVQYVEKVMDTGKPQFVGKKTNEQQVCLAKDYMKYASRKS